MFKPQFIGFVVLVVLMGGCVTTSPSINPTVSPQELVASPSPTAPLTSQPSSLPTVKKPISQPTQPAGGQISCNYAIPAAPGSFGTAQISSQWNNAKVQVCVSANGSPFSPISSDSRSSGSKTDAAAFISNGISYIFSLYDTHNGTASHCGGDILAGCQVNSINVILTTPKPKPLTH